MDCSVTRIYIRLPNWIGDVCMSLPSLQAVLSSGCEVVVCARPWAKKLLGAADFSRFISFEGSVLNGRRLIRSDLMNHPSRAAAGLLLPDSLSSALSFRLAGLPCGGYRDDGRSVLLRWPVSKPQPRLHAVKQWYSLTRILLRQWGFACPEEPPASLRIPLPASAETEAAAMLRQHGLAPGKFVVVAPTATGLHHGRSKIWPHYDQLSKALQARGHTVVMSVPDAERELALNNAPSALLLPPMPLDVFVAFLSKAGLIICNDSGVAHLSSLTSAQSLTLIGVTNPMHTAPWGQHTCTLGREGQWPSPQEVLERSISKLSDNR